MAHCRLVLWIFLLIVSVPSQAADALPYVDPVLVPIIYFGVGHKGTSLDGEAIERLRFMLRRLHADTQERVLVAGFADVDEGSESKCQTISEARAQAVYNWLLANGVPSSQLVGHKGYGATQPADYSHTAEQRRRNRRVEFQHPN